MHERRREQRHVVVGIDAWIDGVAVPIVDISPSAVRVMRPPESGASKLAVEISLAVLPRRGGAARCFQLAGRLVRETRLDMTYLYAPPMRRWDRVLRVHDSFLQTKLSPL